MSPESWVVWKRMRIQETRKERIQRTADIWTGAKMSVGWGASVKNASFLREVLRLSSQWDPSSSNRREYLYIAVIMGCSDFVNGGNKERNSSLVPRCHLLFSLGSLLVFCFLPQMKTRGVKDLRPAQHCAWQPVFTAFRGFHFSICTDPQLMGKTTSYSLMATPDSTTAKAASRPPALFLLTYRFIFCRVEAFTLFPSSLSLFYHSPISCFHSLSLSPSLF